ncbi:MAG: Nicotinate-nucleotide-dimethylbenzimidazole phosphoribosyltransferase [Actinobacteria bacterium]|jgi:nicotinate-nucleotide--dimethylbenzimidazole phosphoribosyltransferase|nr:Nicotinate-nucleotide-dimethylbenzimidazole phosphoribosyltransferase [Actinomycetota bacterium]
MEAEESVAAMAALVAPVDREAGAEALRRHDRLVKPPGSLGRVEAIGVRLAAIAGACPPPVPRRPVVVIAAGDHGVLAQGVSPWPSEVTGAMIAAFCSGTAAVNAIAATVGAGVLVLDVGVASDLPVHPRLRHARVRPGTADLSKGPAMSRAEAAAAVLAGAAAAEDLIAGGADLLVTGDMGIGNSTPAACLIAAFTGKPAAEVTGRGTGIDDATLALKTKVVAHAIDLHRPDARDALGVLAAVGGLEHAALAGLILAGAAHRIPVVLDGVNAVAAALAAAVLRPEAVGYLLAGHRSVEPGASAALDHLGLEPLLDLQMRLGEGTGALLAVPIVIAAASVLRDMATFEEAGIG